MVNQHTVFNDLVRLETELWNELDGRLRRAHGLPLTMYEPMRLLDGAVVCRVRDIAATLGITVGGTSKLVDRLVEAGYVERSTNPRDRRSSVLQLTEAGTATLRAARSTVGEELDTLLTSPLTVAELGTLSSLLDRLRTHLRNTTAVSR